jgi:hypothetical protein
MNYLPPTVAHCEADGRSRKRARLAQSPDRGCPKEPRLTETTTMDFYPEKYHKVDWSQEQWRTECLKLFYAMESEKVRTMQAENRFKNAEYQIQVLAREATRNAGVDEARVAQILKSQNL